MRRNRITKAFILLFSITLLTNASYSFAQTYSYEYDDADWLSVNAPVGIALDPLRNETWVVDTGNNRVLLFGYQGQYFGAYGGFGDDSFDSPRSIAVFSTYKFVTDFGNNRVQKYGEASVYPFAHLLNIGVGILNGPHGIVVDSLGNIYVTDTANNRVVKFDGATGAFIFAWGTLGTANGEFTTPYAIAIDASDRLYVSDSTDRIQLFDATGLTATYLGTWGGSMGRSDGQFMGIRGLYVDSSGNLFVTDFRNSRVQKMNSNGTYMLKWGIFGNLHSMFNTPEGVAVDSSGNIHVVDSGNDRIQVFAPLSSASYDINGDWTFTLTNRQTSQQNGINCTPPADSTSLGVITQNGNQISATIEGASYSGFVSSPVYNITRASTEFSTYDYTEEFVLTFSSATNGSGEFYSGLTDNAGNYCLATGVISVQPANSGGGGDGSGGDDSGGGSGGGTSAGGGGGGGGCFIGSALHLSH